MGQLRDAGNTLDWPSAKKIAHQFRTDGIAQLIALWQKTKDREDDVFLWGDETEGILVTFNDDQRQFQPYIHAADIIENLDTHQRPDKDDDSTCPRPQFHHEAASFNLETTPGAPWGISSSDILDVETNMKWRRSLIEAHLKTDQCYMTLANFPRLGAINKPKPPGSTFAGAVQRSQYLDDEIINSHERYRTITANVRSRRGRKVEILVPIYRDERTPWPFQDPTVDYDLHRWPEDDDVRNGAVKDNHIYMDSALFGIGCCSLQVTVQAKNIDEGRKLYDQLLPLSPILLALTAATPITKGFLADTDVRWNLTVASADDRTGEESGEQALRHDRWRIPKSRCASNSTFMSQDPRLRKEYLESDLVVDEETQNTLVEAGMDQLLATHFAHLFIRDPLLVYEKDLDKVDLDETSRFDIMQSTNWQALRFKPPPSSMSESIGWRVEFRPMEVQITDFENAAFAIFVVLLTRTILHFDLNLYVPISRIDENMETANARDAVLNGKFHFRKNILSERAAVQSPHSHDLPTTSNSTGPVEDEYELMRINEIINGQANGFPGLIPLVRRYLDGCDYTPAARNKLDEYLALIEKRANGTLFTAARWLRRFVGEHPEYEKNSVVGEGVHYDLMRLVRDTVAANGKISAAEQLVGKR